MDDNLEAKIAHLVNSLCDLKYYDVLCIVDLETLLIDYRNKVELKHLKLKWKKINDQYFSEEGDRKVSETVAREVISNTQEVLTRSEEVDLHHVALLKLYRYTVQLSVTTVL
jgi:hypothetical protein